MRPPQSTDVRESYIEKRLIAWAKANGWFFRKLQWIGRNGAPDRLFIKGGRVCFIELKQRGKKPTEIQQREIDKMREAGAEVWVADSIQLGIDILSKPRPRIYPWDEGLI